MKKQSSGRLSQPVIALSHGDTNGISYEIILKVFDDQRIFDFFTPVLFGSAKLISYYNNIVHAQHFRSQIVSTLDDIKPKQLNIIQITQEEIKIEMGKATPVSGQMALLSLERAIQAVQNKQADILVTLPVSKQAIHYIDSSFSGHTEYLQKKFQCDETLMIMVGRTLKIATATTHVPVGQIATLLNKEFLVKKIYLLHQSLIQDFQISSPRIAVLGLNPHAGEGGSLGQEEKNIICPAIEELLLMGVQVFGPFSADGFFGTLKYRDYDAVFAMYHDQALIPFKILCFNEGVNYTAGLPVVRTSPAHGVGFDITGKNVASEESLRHALFLSCEIFKNRQMYEEMYKNPLQVNE